MRSWSGVIYAQAASKANSRRVALNARTGRMLFIGSKKAHSFRDAVALQVPVLPEFLRGRLRLTATFYYRDERPDLDDSVLRDALQKRLYNNDRQVREAHLYHAIDKLNPRVELTVEEIGA